MKGKERNRTRSGVSTREQNEFRAYRYVALVAELPHPMRRVPGIKHCYWNGEIGRWVKVQ